MGHKRDKQYMNYESSRMRRKGQRPYLKNGWKLPKYEEENEYPNSVSQKIPIRMNSKSPTPRPILNKLSKVIDKERILKARRENQLIMYKGASIRLPVDFSEETLQAIGEWDDICKVLQEKTTNQEYYNQQNNPSKLNEKYFPRLI